MPDDDRSALRPATREELMDSLAFALRYRGRKRVHDPDTDTFMARVAAERLCEHLHASGFVVLKKPPLAAPDASRHMPSRLPLKE